MLPLWWPRTACIYCGARIRVDRSRYEHTRPAELLRAADPRWLACNDHAPLVPFDPLAAPFPLALPGVP